MSSESRTVLITGAAGFIGSHLVEACLGRGMRVIGVDSLSDYYPENIKRENIRCALESHAYEFIHGDLLELELERLVSQVDLIFHLAAQPGVRRSWGAGFAIYTRQNLDAFQRLLEASVGKPLHRFVFASSSSVYGDAETFPTSEEVVPRPVSPYGITKAAGEHLAAIYHRNYSVPTVALRYFSVFGPRQRPDMAFHRLIDAAINDEEFVVFGDGRQTRDFTYVGDAVAGTIAAGIRGRTGHVYNIGGGSRISMIDVFSAVEEITGRRLRLRFEGRQPGDARDTSADVSRAAAELHYQPSTGVVEGLHRQIEWQQAMMLDLA
jgi:nucleoside-diphosphate-sugar epimerase